MSARAGSERGFVLLNALLLVAAFAAAAVYVLGRAEAARLRQAEQQGAGQLQLYLDGFEVLAMQVLHRDQQGGAVDTLTDIWAAPINGVTIDRGLLSGQISDLQGRFNVNWLANTQDLGAEAGFTRLVARLGLIKGDIIKSINNTELNSLLHALSVYQDLDELNFLELQIERQGKIFSYFYKLGD